MAQTQVQNQTPEWQFVRMVATALKEPRRGDYCTTIHEDGRYYAKINWNEIDKIYGCAVFKSVWNYERRIMILPGAAVYVVRDKDESWCFTAGAMAVAQDVMSGVYQIHIFQDAEKAKEVCGRIELVEV